MLDWKEKEILRKQIDESKFTKMFFKLMWKNTYKKRNIMKTWKKCLLSWQAAHLCCGSPL